MDNANRQGPVVRELAPAVSSLLQIFKISSDLLITAHTGGTPFQEYLRSL